MERITPQKNEARVLSFSRERLAPGVMMASVSLRQGESSLFHHHSATKDTFYVLQGELTLMVRPLIGAGANPAYHLIRKGRSESHPAPGAGEGLVKVTLVPGDVLVVEPGVVHCAANLGENPCSFLCLEGVGHYDFVPAERAHA